MATLKERSDNWNATSLIIRDHRHDKSDGYEETPHKKVSKKETPRKKPGCRGNNDGPHVYVWVGARFVPNEYGFYNDPIRSKYSYRNHPNYNREWYGWTPFDSQEQHIAFLEAREVQICAGCYRRTGKKRMKDAQAPDTSWWYYY